MRQDTRPEGQTARRIRIAALAAELGRRQGLHAVEQACLRDAAMYQDCPLDLFDGPAFRRLVADVLGVMPEDAPPSFLSSGALEVLRALHNRSKKLGREAKMAEILEIAESLDDLLEAAPYSLASVDEDFEECPFAAAGLSVLRRVTREQFTAVFPQLPVFESAARTAMQILAVDELDLRALERIAHSDPVLAGKVVSCANSAIFMGTGEVRSIPAAIAKIGMLAARQVMLAAIIGSLYRKPFMRPMWAHALESADLAAEFARRTSSANPAEATLAGLVHDIGVLALSLLPSEAVGTCERLVHDGYPRTGAEWLVYGVDHAEAAAEILKFWKFPDDLVEGVRYHHCPEKTSNPIAAILYAVELCTLSDEDMPSRLRLAAAARRLNLTVDQVVAMRHSATLQALPLG